MLCVIAKKKGNIIAVRYFIHYKKSQCVFALAHLFGLDAECLSFSEAGHHTLKVNETDNIVVIPVCEIKEKLFLVLISENSKFVIRMPNMHGHGLKLLK